ncbi:MAG: RNHCP domain-containing protein [Patescibacteria group bacterium]|nr:RNHCP domain-containing protein [Patescibacteria group bacterium]
MKKFQRKIENFICENCGFSVKGTGYTNHCPKCLFSKHVDINPGDRANTCGGLMEPVGLELDHGEYIIVYECEKCGEIKKNKADKNDAFDELLKLAKSLA